MLSSGSKQESQSRQDSLFEQSQAPLSDHTNLDEIPPIIVDLRLHLLAKPEDQNLLLPNPLPKKLSVACLCLKS